MKAARSERDAEATRGPDRICQGLGVPPPQSRPLGSGKCEGVVWLGGAGLLVRRLAIWFGR